MESFEIFVSEDGVADSLLASLVGRTIFPADACRVKTPVLLGVFFAE